MEPVERGGLPPDEPQRLGLHDEVHARPAARLPLPCQLLVVAWRHREDAAADWSHALAAPGASAAVAAPGAFLAFEVDGIQVQWERHTEFCRVQLAAPLTPGVRLDQVALDPWPAFAPFVDWLRHAPGQTLAAIHLPMLIHPLANHEEASAALARAQQWLGGGAVVASLMGRGHSLVVTDLRVRADGLERIVVMAAPGTTASRAGRIAQRLAELEIYRLMALRGLPVAKALSPELVTQERALGSLTEHLASRRTEDMAGPAGAAPGEVRDDGALLQQLTGIAASIEHLTAGHQYRFAATRAYNALVHQRLAELREQPIPGTQTLGEFMQRRVAPAIATVASTEQRLIALSQRTERAGALLRTRVDIATEAQNHQLLARLAHGQALQLQLQSTVEGLSIAAISYYVVSLLLYGAKALKAAGVPLNPEIAAGLLVPLVMWGVWRASRRIHARFFGDVH